MGKAAGRKSEVGKSEASMGMPLVPGTTVVVNPEAAKRAAEQKEQDVGTIRAFIKEKCVVDAGVGAWLDFETRTGPSGQPKMGFRPALFAWCKEQEMPIEKVFAKTLRDKFPWAMSAAPAWRF